MIGSKRLDEVQLLIDGQDGEIQVLLRGHVKNVLERLAEEPLSLLVQRLKDKRNQPHLAHRVQCE